jgi:hypothetical protein
VTIAAGFSAAAADVLNAISGGTTNAINACTPVVTTIGALRALTSSSSYTAVVVRNYAAAGDGGGGTFILNASDTTSPDNSGTIIVDASSRRWYLRTGGQPPSVKQFGAKGDGTTNDSAAFTSASASGEGVILIPKGTYLLSSAISLASPITWIAELGASFTGAGVGANVALPGMVITQGITLSPLGNALPTFCYLAAQGNNVSATTREFAFVAGVRSQFGNGTTGQANTDKVALFGGAQAANGSYNIFGINTSTIVEVGNTTNNGAWGYECDLNNKARHFGNTGGLGGIQAVPASYGVQITGNSDFNNTMGLCITQAAGAGKWNRGITMQGNCIAQSDIESYTQSARWAVLFGTYQYGLDTSGGGFTGAPIRLGNQSALVAMNAAGSATVSIAYIDTSNNLNLGNGATTTIFYNSLQPATDNSVNCGQPTNRWGAVYAAGGVITTSDPSLKTDIAPLPEALPIVKSLEPKTYRWIVGGRKAETVEEEQDVHAVTKDDVDHPVVTIVDGVPVQTFERRTIETPIYDDMPVVNEQGNPVMVEVPSRHVEEVDGQPPDGVLKDDEGRYWTQQTHRVPRMEKQTVQVEKIVNVPGKRTHWGFLAPDVKDVFAKTGMDFGGYVQDETGTQHLRMDQMIPVLWKAVQELAQRLEELEGKK